MRKRRQHSAAVGPGPLESCSNWRCSHPDSLCCGDCALSAGPALSLGFVFHALRSRTNWVSVSFYCVAHYPRERLKSVLSQAVLHNTTKEQMSVHCAHCLIKILDTQKLFGNHSHGHLSSTHPHISLWQYLLSVMGENELLRTQPLLLITTNMF